MLQYWADLKTVEDWFMQITEGDASDSIRKDN